MTVEQHPPSLCSGRRKSQFHLQFPFQLFLCFTLVQMFSSVAQLCLTLCNPMNQACQASLSITNPQSPPKPMSIEPVMPSNHLILCCPLLLLPSIFPSIRIFSNESALRIRWPKYWSFSFNISPSKEHPGLISFRIDWLHLLVVQGTLKSLLQHDSSRASVLQHSAFFMVQLSHPYMTTGKNIALTRWTFVGKVMSLLLLRADGRRRQWQPIPVLLPGKIPWTEEPGRLSPSGLQRVRHD